MRAQSPGGIAGPPNLVSIPTKNRLANMRALCQRCHRLHDRPHHLAQRWITYRRRYALADLYFGPYEGSLPCITGRAKLLQAAA